MALRSSKSEVRSAVGALRTIAPTLAIVSGVVNILALTGSFYMLQVYDRVLSSRSVPTLVALSLLAVVLYLFMGGLEVIRAQILSRLASRTDRRLAPLAHRAVMQLPLTTACAEGTALQPIRDVDAIRSFLASQGPVAILDIPWMPLYLAFVFLLHPVLGWTAVFGMAFLVSMTLLTERLVQGPSRAATEASRQRMAIAEASERNAEVIRAMGFARRINSRFERASAAHLKANENLSDTVGGMTTISKVFRMVLQSALLGLGGYLTLKGEMSAGAIIAGSIASSRALAPIEIVISQWRGFVAARQATSRLDRVLEALPKDQDPLLLPAPKRMLSLENLTVTIPGTPRIALSQVGFQLEAGQVLAVIGPSAAGKSTLARALTGVWPLAKGSVRLDGASLDRWSLDELGKHIGYLPQDVELFDGTITENIARFEEQAESMKVIAAAQAADVHEMVLRMPNGYETRLGDRGAALSAGQRQRIGLARALYGDPFLVVLDEPNSNLDAEGEMALVKALEGVKKRGGIGVVIAHRPSVLAAADLVAVVTAGQLKAFGPKDEVLRKVLRNPVQTNGATPPLSVAMATDA